MSKPGLVLTGIRTDGSRAFIQVTTRDESAALEHYRTTCREYGVRVSVIEVAPVTRYLDEDRMPTNRGAIYFVHAGLC